MKFITSFAISQISLSQTGNKAQFHRVLKENLSLAIVLLLSGIHVLIKQVKVQTGQYFKQDSSQAKNQSAQLGW